jgi:hypothetical protein
VGGQGLLGRGSPVQPSIGSIWSHPAIGLYDDPDEGVLSCIIVYGT